MSEAEWLSTPCLHRLVTAGVAVTRRKQRLFGVACCRWASEHVDDPDIPDAIVGAEAVADNVWPRRQLEAIRRLFRRRDDPAVGWHTEHEYVHALASAVLALLDEPAPLNRVVGDCHWAVYGYWGSDPTFADLYREVAGNPYRPVAFDPTWRTPTVEAVAAACYSTRDFARLPVLADALEDAGCEAADLLAHLRGSGPHVRGCWALDAVLGNG